MVFVLDVSTIEEDVRFELHVATRSILAAIVITRLRYVYLLYSFIAHVFFFFHLVKLACPPSFLIWVFANFPICDLFRACWGTSLIGMSSFGMMLNKYVFTSLFILLHLYLYCLWICHYEWLNWSLLLLLFQVVCSVCDTEQPVCIVSLSYYHRQQSEKQTCFPFG